VRHRSALASQPVARARPHSRSVGTHRGPACGLARSMAHARSFPPASARMARIAPDGTREGRGLPRRFWPFAATGLLRRSCTQSSWRARGRAGDLPPPPHGVPVIACADEASASVPRRATDMLPAGTAGHPRAAPDRPSAARSEDRCRRRCGPGTARARRAMRSRARMTVTLRATAREQPSMWHVRSRLVRRQHCDDTRRPRGDTYVTRKDSPGVEESDLGRSVFGRWPLSRPPPLRWGPRGPEFFLCRRGRESTELLCVEP